MAIKQADGLYMCQCGDYGLKAEDICLSCGWCVLGCCTWEDVNNLNCAYNIKKDARGGKKRVRKREGKS